MLIENQDTNRYSFRAIIDLFKIISREDRLRILFALGSGSHSVSDLIMLVHGDLSNNHSSQTSTALAPMRRLGLISSEHRGRHSYYVLTDLGREVFEFVSSIDVREIMTRQ